MASRVDITDPALADAEEHVRFLVETRKEPKAAAQWLEGLAAAAGTLEQVPERCPRIPEADDFDSEIRHLIYFSHRIVFGLDRKRRVVTIYRIYHGARRNLAPDSVD